MSKILRVDEKVYDELNRLRVGHQTFSDVISEMLKARLRMLELMNVLEGQLKFREWQRDQIAKLTNADAVRGDVDARRLK